MLMQKYQCTVCMYIYDPEKGDDTQGLNQVLLLKIYLLTGLALIVE